MEELKEYIMKTTGEKLIILAAGVIFCAGGGYLFTIEEYIFGAIITAFGLFALIGGMTAGRSDRAFFDKLEESGKLSEVVADFVMAKSFADDKVRFGEKYIFQRKLAKITAYSDITWVNYSSSIDHTNNHTTWEYRLTVGEGRKLAQPLYSLGYDHPEMAREMIDIIRSHNPMVEEK